MGLQPSRDSGETKSYRNQARLLQFLLTILWEQEKQGSKNNEREIFTFVSGVAAPVGFTNGFCLYYPVLLQDQGACAFSFKRYGKNGPGTYPVSPKAGLEMPPRGDALTPYQIPVKACRVFLCVPARYKVS